MGLDETGERRHKGNIIFLFFSFVTLQTGWTNECELWVKRLETKVLVNPKGELSQVSEWVTWFLLALWHSMLCAIIDGVVLFKCTLTYVCTFHSTGIFTNPKSTPLRRWGEVLSPYPSIKALRPAGAVWRHRGDSSPTVAKGKYSTSAYQPGPGAERWKVRMWAIPPPQVTEPFLLRG